MAQTTDTVEVGEATKKSWADKVYNDLVELYSTSGVLRRFLGGLRVTNNGSDPFNDIDISTGSCTDSEASVIGDLSSSITKRLDASWAVGTNQGGLFSGSKTADTWYHVILIRKDSDGTIDVGFDTDEDGANAPVGWSAIRRLWSIVTDGGNKIRQFTAIGDYCHLDKPIQDYSNTSITKNTWYTVTHTVPAITDPCIMAVGTLICENQDVTYTEFSIYSSPAGSTFYTSGGSAIDALEHNAASDDDTLCARFIVPVNSSAQSRIMAWTDAGGSANFSQFRVNTYGWYDTRGK